jgi:hypothetical protein
LIVNVPVAFCGFAFAIQIELRRLWTAVENRVELNREMMIGPTSPLGADFDQN